MGRGSAGQLRLALLLLGVFSIATVVSRSEAAPAAAETVWTCSVDDADEACPPTALADVLATVGLHASASSLAPRPMVFRGAARDWPLVQHAALLGPELLLRRAAKDDGSPRTLNKVRTRTRKPHRDRDLQGENSSEPKELPKVPFVECAEAERHRAYDDVVEESSWKNRKERNGVAMADVVRSANDAAAPEATYWSGDIAALGLLDEVPADFPAGLRASKRRDARILGFVATAWLSSRDVVASLHYDAHANLFVQVLGSKTLLLLPPRLRHTLALYPSLHPRYRQSQLAAADFRAVAALPGVEAVTLAPGDVIFLPAFWFHQVEAAPNPEEAPEIEEANFTLSTNFWMEDADVERAEGVFEAPVPLEAEWTGAKQRRVACRYVKALVVAFGESGGFEDPEDPKESVDAAGVSDSDSDSDSGSDSDSDSEGVGEGTPGRSCRFVSRLVRSRFLTAEMRPTQRDVGPESEEALEECADSKSESKAESDEEGAGLEERLVTRAREVVAMLDGVSRFGAAGFFLEDLLEDLAAFVTGDVRKTADFLHRCACQAPLPQL